jgi:hypothetical protein
MTFFSRAALGGLLFLACGLARAEWSSEKAIAPGEGAVLLTVAVDYSNWGIENLVNQYGFPSLVIAKVDGAKSERFKFLPRVAGLISARAYAGSLPPGRYRIFDIRDGDMLAEDRPTEKNLAEFDVVAGEVTYLGSVMTRPQLKTDSKDVEHFWAYEEHPSLAVGQRLLDGLYAGLAASKPTIAVHWQPFSLGAQAAADARSLMRAEATGLNGFNRWGEDGFCFGAQHGMAKCWNRSGGYQQFATDSFLVLHSVQRYGDRRIVVGGEGTTLLYSEDDGAHWSDLAAGLPWGIVENVEAIGNDEVLFDLVSDGKVRLYRGRPSERNWKLLGEYAFGSTFVKAHVGAFPSLSVQGHSALLALPTTKAMYFDLDSGESHEIAPPGTLVAMNLGGDGAVHCICGFGPKESHDQGLTWQETMDGRSFVLPAFRNANEAFVYKFVPFSKKGSGNMATVDGGKTWSPISAPPIDTGDIFLGWTQLAYTRDGTVMLMSSRTQSRKFPLDEFNVSMDGGKTWERGSKLPSWATRPENR